MIRRPIAKLKLFSGVEIKWAENRHLYYGQKSKNKEIQQHSYQSIKHKERNDDTKEISKEKQISFFNNLLKYLKNTFFGDTKGVAQEKHYKHAKCDKPHDTKLSAEYLNSFKLVDHAKAQIEKTNQEISNNQKQLKSNENLTKTDCNTDRKAQLQENIFAVKSSLTNSQQYQKRKHNVAQEQQGLQSNSVNDTIFLPAGEPVEIPKLNTKPQEPQKEINLYNLEGHIQNTSEQQNLSQSYYSNQQKERSFTEQQLLNTAHNINQPSQDQQNPNIGFVYHFQSLLKPDQQQQTPTAYTYQQYPNAAYNVNQTSQDHQFVSTGYSNQLPQPQNQQQQTNAAFLVQQYPNAACNVNQPSQDQQCVNSAYKTQSQPLLKYQQQQTNAYVFEQKCPNAAYSVNQPSRDMQYVNTGYSNPLTPPQNQQQQTNTTILGQQYPNAAYNSNQLSQYQQYLNSAYKYKTQLQQLLNQQQQTKTDVSVQKYPNTTYSVNQPYQNQQYLKSGYYNNSNHLLPSHNQQQHTQAYIIKKQYPNAAYYVNQPQVGLMSQDQKYTNAEYNNNHLPLQTWCLGQLPPTQEPKLQTTSSDQQLKTTNNSPNTNQQLTQKALTQQEHLNAAKNYNQHLQQYLQQQQIQKTLPYQNAYHVNPTLQSLFPGQQFLNSTHYFNVPMQHNLQQQPIPSVIPNQHYQSPYYLNNQQIPQTQNQTYRQSFPNTYQQYQNVPVYENQHYQNQMYQHQQPMVKYPFVLPTRRTPSQTENMEEYRRDFVRIKGEQKNKGGKKSATNQEDRLLALANLLDELKKIQRGSKKHN